MLTNPPFNSSALTPTGPTTLTSTPSSSMALTITIFIVVLFFLGFFSIFARHFFAGVTHTPDTNIAHRHPTLLLSTDHGYHRRYLTPNIATAGLDPATVRALPVLTYTGGTKEVEVVVCVVCLGGFEEEERVKLIPGCGHVFHPGCIDGWLVLHGSCPICRRSAVFGAGVRSRGEVWVNLGGDGAHEESTGDSEDEEREFVVGLGRSKSFNRSNGGGESAVSLRRTCSV